MRVLDLFSGIGGASLGLHWAGMRTVAFCERDRFCAGVLRRHWPDVPVYDDVRTLTAARLRADGVPWAELLVGGFPCQDVSLAGRGAGLEGARSGLWSDMERLVAECRPRWVVAENVPGLRGRGADRVCAGLEALGYACWPLVVGAVHAGAPHRRQRVWVVGRIAGAAFSGASADALSGASPDALSGASADATRPGLEVGQRGSAGAAPGLPVERRGRWPAEPGVRRVGDGLPAGLDRLRAPRIQALGNAIVPANAAMLGRAILAADAAP